MDAPERLEWTFVKAIVSHTIEVVGGGLFAAGALAWSLATWIEPTLDPPGFQIWILAAIAVGFFFVAAFKAWKGEHIANTETRADNLQLTASKPDPVIHVERLRQTDVRLGVTNNGSQGTFWVRMIVRGDIEDEINCLPVWSEQDNQTRQSISKGETVTLRVALLNVFNVGTPPIRYWWEMTGFDPVSGYTLLTRSNKWLPEELAPVLPTFTIDINVMCDPDSVVGVVKKRLTFVGLRITDEKGADIS